MIQLNNNLQYLSIMLPWSQLTVGYKLSPIYLAYICLRFGTLALLKVC